MKRNYSSAFILLPTFLFFVSYVFFVATFLQHSESGVCLLISNAARVIVSH